MIDCIALEDRIRVYDGIENVSYELSTDPLDAVDSADTGVFRVPVTEAYAFETSYLTVPQHVGVYVRDGPDLVLDAAVSDDASVPPGTYVVEFSTAPIKLYVRVEGVPVRIDHSGDGTRVDFGESTRVVVGVRSRHQHPAGTVTTTDDPRDLMRAVSTFGSALKTLTPERSFPTLRGHPPYLEQGEEFHAPEHLQRRPADVRIEVPCDRASVYTVATLAYYLGAEVVPGPSRLVADGVEFPLDDLQADAQSVLKHCFTLDCIVRTEGLYHVPLAERERFESRVDVDLAELYNLDLGERTAAYLDIPRSATDDLLEWHLTTDVDPEPENAVVLPFVANDLSYVRSPAPVEDPDAVAPEPDGLSAFFRTDAAGAEAGTGAGTGTGTGTGAGETRAAGTSDSAGTAGAPSLASGVDTFLRSAERSANATTTPDEQVVSPVETDTIGHAWVARNFPMGASKPTVDSFRRRLDRTLEDDETIHIHVICTDEEMREETENLYGFRDLLEFDVETSFDLTVEELRAALERETDFLHFIGHVSEEGMRCADGYLDLHTLEETGVDAFILNGCTSYEQGMQLVDAGALGGVVTLEDVYNTVATTVGRSLARLLDNGFDLHGALDVATESVVAGHHYTIVGNASISLCQSNNGMPLLTVVESPTSEQEQYSVSVCAYPTYSFGIGSFGTLFFSDETRYLFSGVVDEFELSEKQLRESLSTGRSPFLVDGELHWSDELTISDI